MLCCKPTNQLSGYEISRVKDALQCACDENGGKQTWIEKLRDTFTTNDKSQIQAENFSE